MARKTRREKQRAEVSKEADVDMTPMIDVVFLLVIFFLCIDFKMLEAKLPTYLPKDRGSSDGYDVPQPHLRIQIVCDNFGVPKRRLGFANAYRLIDHRVHYSINTTRVKTFEELEQQLRLIYEDRDLSRIPDTGNPGQMKVMKVVVEPGVGTVYADVAQTVDAVIAAGFPVVHFGGGLGSKRFDARAKK